MTYDVQYFPTQNLTQRVALQGRTLGTIEYEIDIDEMSISQLLAKSTHGTSIDIDWNYEGGNYEGFDELREKAVEWLVNEDYDAMLLDYNRIQQDLRRSESALNAARQDLIRMEREQESTVRELALYHAIKNWGDKPPHFTQARAVIETLKEWDEGEIAQTFRRMWLGTGIDIVDQPPTRPLGDGPYS